jgi:hypothetical protein
MHELQRDQLEKFEKLKLSLMPSGLQKLLSPQEMADVVAYLQLLKKT